MAETVTNERARARSHTRYQDDLYTWVKEQVALLAAGRFHEIDAAGIAEELGDVGHEQFDKLESALRVLVLHMLKWDQQPEFRTPSWVYSIQEQRDRYATLLKRNPGLKSRRNEALAGAYKNARRWAGNETNLVPSEFPDECPYVWNEILDRPFEADAKR